MTVFSGTLKQLADLRGYDKTVGLLDEAMGDFPELGIFTGRTIKGTKYKVALVVDRPKGGFRRVNEGVDAGQAKFKQFEVSTYIHSNPIVVDKEEANASEDGRDAYIATISSETLKGSIEGLASRIYYGGAGEEEIGFPGLRAYAENGYGLTLDAGATGNTADKTSVYLARIGSDGVELVFGMDDGLRVGSFREEFVPGANGKMLNALVAPLDCWIGLGVNHPSAFVHIKGIDDSKTVSDKLLNSALFKLPVKYKTDKTKLVWLMNSRAIKQLQDSRSAINVAAYKAGAIADYPTEAFGIKIVETSSILDNEKVA